MYVLVWYKATMMMRMRMKMKKMMMMPMIMMRMRMKMKMKKKRMMMGGHRCNHPYPYYSSAVCNLLSCYYINAIDYVRLN